MRTIRNILFAFCVLLVGHPALAQGSYPDKPVRLVVGFTAGSATDLTARLFAQKFSDAWGVPVTVENVPGAGGSTGVERVAKSAPDGYTLMYAGNGAITVAPNLQAGLGYDPARDLTPISLVLMMPSIVAVNNAVPAKSLQELLALAKSQPGKLSCATPGVGTPQHIAFELLKMMADVNMVHVPYRGAVLADVLGGRVPVTMQNAGAILPMVREGQLRGIAVTSIQRSPNMPDLPTVAESGYPGFEAVSWFAIMGPAGTPAVVVEKVRGEAAKVLADPEMRPRWAQLGVDPVGSSPEELAARIRSELPKWGKVIKDAGIKTE